MIGERIKARRGTPAAGIVSVFLAIVVVVAGLVLHSRALLWIALLPALVAVACVVGRRARLAITFTATGVLLDDTPSEIPYTAIQALQRVPSDVAPAKAPPRLQAICLYHDSGLIRLVAPLSRPLDQIYALLLERLGLSGSRAIHPALAPHLQAQIETFGAQRVYSFRSRFQGRRPARWRWSGDQGRPLRIGLACVVVGIAWLVGAPAKPEDMFVVAGALLIVGGLLATLLSRAPFAAPRGNLSDAALVISPLGLALKLGDVLGQLKWEEVRDVKLGRERRDIWITGRPIGPLRVEVEGARIDIPDWFDRPVELIHRLICHYWRGAPLAGPPAVQPPPTAPVRSPGACRPTTP